MQGIYLHSLVTPLQRLRHLFVALHLLLEACTALGRVVAVIRAQDFCFASCTVRCVAEFFEQVRSDAEVAPQTFFVLPHGSFRELGAIASQVDTFGVPKVIGLLLLFVAGVWLPRSGYQFCDLFCVPFCRIWHANNGSHFDHRPSINECHAVLSGSGLDA